MCKYARSKSTERGHGGAGRTAYLTQPSPSWPHRPLVTARGWIVSSFWPDFALFDDTTHPRVRRQAFQGSLGQGCVAGWRMTEVQPLKRVPDHSSTGYGDSRRREERGHDNAAWSSGRRRAEEPLPASTPRTRDLNPPGAHYGPKPIWEASSARLGMGFHSNRASSEGGTGQNRRRGFNEVDFATVRPQPEPWGGPHTATFTLPFPTRPACHHPTRRPRRDPASRPASSDQARSSPSDTQARTLKSRPEAGH
jgi:hypothetical protein